MILHGFAWRNSKNTVLIQNTVKFDHKFKKYTKHKTNSSENMAAHCKNPVPMEVGSINLNMKNEVLITNGMGFIAKSSNRMFSM